MNLDQMYNHSAMLYDAFRSKANESTNPSEKQKLEKLAQEQKAITEQIRVKANDGVTDQNPPTENPES